MCLGSRGVSNASLAGLFWGPVMILGRRPRTLGCVRTRNLRKTKTTPKVNLTKHSMGHRVKREEDHSLTHSHLVFVISAFNSPLYNALDLLSRSINHMNQIKPIPQVRRFTHIQTLHGTAINAYTLTPSQPSLIGRPMAVLLGVWESGKIRNPPGGTCSIPSEKQQLTSCHSRFRRR